MDVPSHLHYACSGVVCDLERIPVYMMSSFHSASGGPYWSVLIKALESSHLGHNGIAAQIRREQLHDN